MWKLLLVLFAFSASAVADSCRVTNADDRIAAAFEDAGVSGVMLAWREGTEACLSNAPSAVGDRDLPASTFKIFNSLVALETGVIEDEHVVFPWDGVERQIASWNRDHDLATAIRYSAVWYYQELARRIGPDRMQAWIDRVGYGNRDISGGIDRFWLDGGLRISPREQVALLVALADDSLPFSSRSQEIVRRILIQETDVVEGVLRGKTGWVVRVGPDVGWFVGWLENASGRWFFATRLDMEKREHASARRSLTLEVLKALSSDPVGSMR